MKDKIIQLVKRNEFMYGLSEHGNVYVMVDRVNSDSGETYIDWHLEVSSPKIAQSEKPVLPEKSAVPPIRETK